MCYLCLYVGGLVGVLPVPVCWWAGRSVTCACMLVRR